ncbi:MAG: hypothetical protein EWM45_04030 [Rhodopseudomonas palustris]|nr:MAG: hypothetical protein EWM45_04030 [Rhodopseudomonas palustris]
MLRLRFTHPATWRRFGRLGGATGLGLLALAGQAAAATRIGAAAAHQIGAQHAGHVGAGRVVLPQE